MILERLLDRPPILDGLFCRIVLIFVKDEGKRKIVCSCKRISQKGSNSQLFSQVPLFGHC